MDIKSTLKELSCAAGIGTLRNATDIAEKILSHYAQVRRTDNLGLLADIKGERDYTVMVEAHIDEVGFVVTDIDENGFLTVSNCGGIDLRALPSRQVDIHGKETVRGVFCSTPPHLKESDGVFENISEYKIDTCLGETAKEVISVGDYVTFCTNPLDLSGDRLCGKSFDDRAGIAVLLELARRFKDKKPPVNIVFCLSDMEETGLRGAKTSAFDISPDEAIAVDVSFGDGPTVNPLECGKLGNGAMIGISPVLNKKITDKLLKIAKENNISFQTEVMGRSTGTDADVISVSKSGIKTGLVSIPLRNMHTDCEIISVSDIKSVCDLLEVYIKGGGISD